MALNDILQSIAEDTAKEIAAIEKESKEKSKQLETEYAEKLAQEKIRLLKNIETEAQRKISQARFQVQSLAKNKILKKKQELLAQVYSQVLENLSNLPAKDYRQLLENQLKSLPNLEQGEIKVNAKDKAEINKLADKLKLKYKVTEADIKSKGGFIFEAEGLVIDNTLEAITQRLQDQTETTVAQIIFS